MVARTKKEAHQALQPVSRDCETLWLRHTAHGVGVTIFSFSPSRDALVLVAAVTGKENGSFLEAASCAHAWWDEQLLLPKETA